MDNFDVKAKIEELVGKIKGDDELQRSFKADPVKAVEKLLGIDLPDDILQKLVAGVKAKLNLDNLGGIGNALGSLLGKK